LEVDIALVAFREFRNREAADAHEPVFAPVEFAVRALGDPLHRSLPRRDKLIKAGSLYQYHSREERVLDYPLLALYRFGFIAALARFLQNHFQNFCHYAAALCGAAPGCYLEVDLFRAFIIHRSSALSAA
jgi:hypothetical protein